MIYLNPYYFFKGDSYSATPFFQEELPIYCSLDNYFIPVFAGKSGTVLRTSTKKIILYNINKGTDNQICELPSSIARFINAFHQGSEFTTFTDSSTNQCYYTMKHFIYTNENNVIVPLYCLCSTNHEIFNINPGAIPDYTKLFLILNSELMNPVHKKLFAKIKLITKYLEALEVNIITTNNPSDLFFKQEILNTFATLDDRIAFINQIKAKLGNHEPIDKIATISTPSRATAAEYARVTAEFA